MSIRLAWAAGSSRYPSVTFRRIFVPIKRMVPPDAAIVTAYTDGQVTLRSNRSKVGYHEAADLSGFQGVEPGDFVVHGLDIMRGSVGVSDSRGAISAVCTVCLPSERVDGRFIAYAMRAQAVSGFPKALARGVREGGADFRRWDTLGDLPVPCPPLSEQRRIADFLDVTSGQIRAILEARGAQSRLLRERFDSSLVQTVLRADADTWRKTRLKYLFQFERNGVWGDEPLGDGDDVLCVRVADFDRLSLRVRDDGGTTRRVSPSQFVTRALRSGDVLLEKSGGGDASPVGFAVTYEGHTRAVCSNFQAALRPSPDVDNRFAALLMAALYKARRNLPFIKQTTGIQNLDAAGYLSQEVWVPPLRTQETMVRELDSNLSTVRAALMALDRQQDVLRERRQALIAAAVTGQIDVTTARGVDV